MNSILLIALASGLPACGGGNGDSTTPTPAPTISASRDAFGCLVGEWQVTGGVPTATQYQTDHFAFHSDLPDVTAEDMTKAGTLLEGAYADYANTIGFKPPQCELTIKTKINVNLVTSNGTSSAGSRNGVGYIDLTQLALFTDHTVVHELVHVFQSATAGWSVLPSSFWETHANFMVAQLPAFRGDVDCSEDAINSAHLAHGNARTRYCGWQFLDHLASTIGYEAINDIWRKATASAGTIADQYTVLAANQGWSAATLNDRFASWAVRNVTWDYTTADGFDRGALFRARYGDYVPDTSIPYRSRRLTTLDPVDLPARRFAVPFAWAPQRWGYNVVRLVPDAGVASITVSFRGIPQESAATTTLPGAAGEPQPIVAPASGWRWSIVIVDSDGKPRYADIKQGGDESLSVALAAGDQAAYLVVIAAPTTFEHVNDDQPYYSIYRYPWMVQVDGAMPWGYQQDAPARIAGGHRHPNGNGWVGPDASVDASAYVGPYARVYGGQVSGNARIEDHAMVSTGTIGDNGRIGALTTLAGSARIVDDARIAGVLGTIAGNGFVMSGTAQLLGDVQIAGDVRQLNQPVFAGFAHGIYYGMILQSDGTDATKGAERTAPVPEVTQQPAYVWR